MPSAVSCATIFQPALLAPLCVTIGRQGHCLGIIGINDERLLQAAKRRVEALAGKFIFELLSTQEQIVGVKISYGLMLHPFDFGELNIRFDRSDDAFGDAILQLEHVTDPAVKAVRPYLCPRRRIDELRRKSKLIARSPDASFKHITHTELAPDLPHINRLAFVGKRGVSRDDKQRIAV